MASERVLERKVHSCRSLFGAGMKQQSLRSLEGKRQPIRKFLKCEKVHQLTLQFIYMPLFDFFGRLMKDFVSPNSFIHCEDMKVPEIQCEMTTQLWAFPLHKSV